MSRALTACSTGIVSRCSLYTPEQHTASHSTPDGSASRTRFDAAASDTTTTQGRMSIQCISHTSSFLPLQHPLGPGDRTNTYYSVEQYYNF